jgi:hypothetical protein
LPAATLRRQHLYFCTSKSSTGLPVKLELPVSTSLVKLVKLVKLVNLVPIASKASKAIASKASKAGNQGIQLLLACLK